MDNRDLGEGNLASRLTALLIEQADATIAELGLPRLMLDGDGTGELRGIDVFADRRNPLRTITAIRTVSLSQWFAEPKLFTYGPFRNRPKRLAITPERRQRLARRIERAHRK